MPDRSPRYALRLYAGTLARMRLHQIVARVRLRSRRRRQREFRNLESRRVPPFPGLRTGREAGRLVPPGFTGLKRSLLEGRFRLLNRTRRLGWPPQWKELPDDLPWNYRLAYLEYAWMLEWDELHRLADSFTAALQGQALHPAWDPYPTSVRLLNLALICRREASRQALGADEARHLWPLIWFHAEWVRRNLEFDLLGNHLLENAFSLAAAGLVFGGRAAKRWERIGRRILARELRRQILGDGLHYERSPMYHARILRHLVNLGVLCGGLQADPLAGYCPAMIRALVHLTHPDGQPALFNDCVMHEEVPLERLASAVGATGGPSGADLRAAPGAWSLPCAGYYGWRDEQGNALVVDAGELGPPENPGHAHGDIFSFELSLRGRRVVVDSGTFGYQADGMRNYCRSTAAHNTVEINGRDQADFWRAFRVSGFPRVRDLRWRPAADGFVLQAEHDGYRRLRGGARHSRRLAWFEEGVLLITDRITARRPVTVISRMHLHPDWLPCATAAGKVELVSPSGDRVTVGSLGGAEVWLETGWYCPEFGVRRACYVVCTRAGGRHVRLQSLVAREGDWDMHPDEGARRGAETFPW